MTSVQIDSERDFSRPAIPDVLLGSGTNPPKERAGGKVGAWSPFQYLACHSPEPADYGFRSVKPDMMLKCRYPVVPPNLNLRIGIGRAIMGVKGWA